MQIAQVRDFKDVNLFDGFGNKLVLKDNLEDVSFHKDISTKESRFKKYKQLYFKLIEIYNKGKEIILNTSYKVDSKEQSFLKNLAEKTNNFTEFPFDYKKNLVFYQDFLKAAYFEFIINLFTLLDSDMSNFDNIREEMGNPGGNLTKIFSNSTRKIAQDIIIKFKEKYAKDIESLLLLGDDFKNKVVDIIEKDTSFESIKKIDQIISLRVSGYENSSEINVWFDSIDQKIKEVNEYLEREDLDRGSVLSFLKEEGLQKKNKI